MVIHRITFITIIPLIFLVGCKGEAERKGPTEVSTVIQEDSIAIDSAGVEESDTEAFELTEENAIPFFFD